MSSGTTAAANAAAEDAPQYQDIFIIRHGDRQDKVRATCTYPETKVQRPLRSCPTHVRLHCNELTTTPQ
jgi:hypothetical protein